ncbi:hypothetical protein BDP27DRAFT_1416774 [Rhodocollybia butyracea]|uniref:Metaxin glutathione S-transferase domain-containing protein n=1 Tax=Rhodocollybia butyracea TaxID=206335 RepID=A0A9P5Q1D2_9AGAR|nr:hypothetical protein BDP27DRAFT_1416774 [Rhodocollybia butyracea]
MGTDSGNGQLGDRTRAPTKISACVFPALHSPASASQCEKGRTANNLGTPTVDLSPQRSAPTWNVSNGRRISHSEASTVPASVPMSTPKRQIAQLARSARRVGDVFLDSQQQGSLRWVIDDLWEGYKDEAAKDESRAWYLFPTLILPKILAQPSRSFLRSLFAPPTPPSTAQSLLVPPPTSGFFPSYSITFLSPFGTTSNNPNARVSAAMKKAIFNDYADAIKALSEKLGSQKWFLGSEHPTPLDALLFAYLHCLLGSSDVVRAQVTERVNLVAWELRVRRTVKAAFVS